MHPEILTLATVLAQTRQTLEMNGIPDSALEARSLVREAAGISQTELLTRSDQTIDPRALAVLEEYTARRVGREPLQYITAKVEFYGREFAVDRRVLIPRPETEILIEQALLRINERRLATPKVMDIGTGSGVLAVTMAAEVPTAQVSASDISSDALDVARLNAARHNVGERIEFHRESLTHGISGRYDIVLCNPPYVLSRFLDGPDVQPELAHEPRMALDGGEDGMDIYSRLLPELRNVMSDTGAAYIEIDPPVSERCLSLAKQLMPTASVSVLTDLSGLERCLAIELPD